ncbi:solute carrier family 25 member [Acrasis kona]|uniref:Solute carrier family 25 member n=1 Tax=Acrasis kona TaxID=1008807 RepID=A0AAW2Z3M1_9EUKA
MENCTTPRWQTFLFSTISPIGAVIITNPFDTAKVRLQLQGQFDASQRIYKNSFDAILKIYKHEGLVGLQKGLVPAMWREGSKNVMRIGMYEPIMERMHDKKRDGPLPMWKRILAGGTSGALGALACNPFELIKTRMQAQSNSKIVVGHQHQYSSGLWPTMYNEVKKNGVFTLYKGSGMSVVRSFFGSGANLSIYSYMRDNLISKQYMKDGFLVDATSGLTSSLFTALVMNPVDVLRTRIYNQAVNAETSNVVYKNGIDALFKVVKNEGVKALFKGWVASFARLGPHFTLTFVFFEELKRLSRNFNKQ